MSGKTLVARGVRYFSPGDETAFFEWARRIRSVVRIEGMGDAISIEISSALIDEADLRELIALFHRYGVSSGQLRAFDADAFAPWFRDPTAYWYATVFGD